MSHKISQDRCQTQSEVLYSLVRSCDLYASASRVLPSDRTTRRILIVAICIQHAPRFKAQASNRINDGTAFPPEIVRIPTPRGNENRLGPADPGLKRIVRPRRSIVGR